MTKSKKPQKQLNPLAQANQLIRKKMAKLSTIPDTEAPSVLYHYTSLAGLKGILGDKKMHATRINYLNDPMETTFGLRQCIEVLGHFVKENARPYIDFDKLALETLHNRTPQNAYVVSFSSVPDGLLQWQMYADRGKGVSIGFSFEDLNDVVSEYLESELDSNQSESILVPDYMPIRIDYGTELQFGRLEEFWNTCRAAYEIVKDEPENSRRVHDSLCVRMLLGLASSHKQEGFSGEQEWRFVTTISADFPHYTKFGEKDDLLIPYLEMPVSDRTHGEPPPIKKIVIGPALNDPYIKDTLILLLKSRGYGQNGIKIPEVVESNTVIRG
ncbi:MAG: DUF2971 domain-containing protein [Candidatus Hydrogenedentes bacterium]|nr:DUF2971 domain-containing protein [Candidatus Hydrogenedentota bacterium]